jgi:hypothetical protein
MSTTEKRRTPRLRKRLRIILADARQQRTGTTTNLSRSGLNIQCPLLLVPGADVQGWLVLPTATVAFRAEVMWARKPAAERALQEQHTAGLRFVGPPDGRYEQFLAAELAAHPDGTHHGGTVPPGVAAGSGSRASGSYPVMTGASSPPGARTSPPTQPPPVRTSPPTQPPPVRTSPPTQPPLLRPASSTQPPPVRPPGVYPAPTSSRATGQVPAMGTPPATPQLDDVLRDLERPGTTPPGAAVQAYDPSLRDLGGDPPPVVTRTAEAPRMPAPISKPPPMTGIPVDAETEATIVAGDLAPAAHPADATLSLRRATELVEETLVVAMAGRTPPDMLSTGVELAVTVDAEPVAAGARVRVAATMVQQQGDRQSFFVTVCEGPRVLARARYVRRLVVRG